VQLFYDRQNVIYLAKNQVYYARTKYIDVRLHMIMELVSSSELLLEKVWGVGAMPPQYDKGVL
jgi:hypothetical protein